MFCVRTLPLYDYLYPSRFPVPPPRRNCITLLLLLFIRPRLKNVYSLSPAVIWEPRGRRGTRVVMEMLAGVPGLAGKTHDI